MFALMGTLFILNPGAGTSRRKNSLVDNIYQTYQDAGQNVLVEEIDFGDLGGQIKQAGEAGVSRIFAVGGDGTVNAIGSRLIGTSLHFGVIPAGSGNGYARNLGFSINTSLAIRQSLHARTILVDTGVFDGHPFLNVAGCGLDAEVAWYFSMAGRRGFGPYAKSTFQTIRKLKPAHYELDIDGEVHQVDNLFGIIIANGAQWGYDAKVARDVSLTDGQFDILTVGRFSMLLAGVMAFRMFNGTLNKSRRVSTFQGRHIIIRRKHSGPIQVDGEALEGSREIHVSVVPESLRLLLPNTLTQEKINTI